MNIFECSFRGNAEDVINLLEASPELVNKTREIPILGKAVTLTPLFLAAIAGKADAVKALVERGALLSLEDGDLFSWGLLCPNLEARANVIDLIFQEQMHTEIPHLDPGYQKIATSRISKEELDALQETSYRYTPSETSLLASSISSMLPDEVLIAPQNAPRFMELRKYRTELYKSLELSGFSVYEMIDSPSDVNLPSSIYYSLLWAADIGDLETLKKDVASQQIDLRENLGTHLASQAAKRGHAHVIEFLRQAGVDLSKPLESGTQEGKTPACFAATCGHVEALKVLAELRVDLSKPLESGKHEGWTPACFAAVFGHAEALKVLAELKVDLSKSLESGKREGWNPAYVAAQQGKVEALKALHAVGVDLSKPLESGRAVGVTPAYIAAACGHAEALKVLTELKVDLSKPLESGEWEGCTPAHVAAEQGKVEALKVLKEAGVDLSKPLESGDWEGWTPAFAAAEYGHAEALKVLAELRVDLSKPLESGAKKGWTPLLIGSMHPQVLEFFDIEASLHGGVKDLIEKDPKAGAMHLASLTLNVDAVKALIRAGYSAKDLIGAPSPFLSVVDFVLMREGANFGPLSIIEEKQITMLNFFIEQGFEKKVVLDQIQSKFPRLVDAFKSESEKLLEVALMEKSLIKKILSGVRTLPDKRGRIVWSQGDVEHLIPSEEVGEKFFNAILSLLSKCDQDQLSEQIVEKLTQMLNEVPRLSTKKPHALELSPEKATHFAWIFQTIEEASHLLLGGRFDPTTVTWDDSEVQETKRQRLVETD